MTALADNFPLASNGFPAHVGTTAPPYPLLGQMWFNPDTGVIQIYNGTIWDSVSTAVDVQVIDLNTPGGANIGAAFVAWDALPGNSLTGSLVFATYGSPLRTYVLADLANPSVTASWTVITDSSGIDPTSLALDGGNF